MRDKAEGNWTSLEASSLKYWMKAKSFSNFTDQNIDLNLENIILYTIVKQKDHFANLVCLIAKQKNVRKQMSKKRPMLSK